LGEIGSISELDLAGNAGADTSLEFDAWRITCADRIDRHVRAVSEGDDISICRKSFAELWRKRKALGG
jgi:hypothetical protein